MVLLIVSRQYFQDAGHQQNRIFYAVPQLSFKRWDPSDRLNRFTALQRVEQAILEGLVAPSCFMIGSAGSGALTIC